MEREIIKLESKKLSPKEMKELAKIVVETLQEMECVKNGLVTVSIIE